jgi:hypothetical protein
MAITLDTLAVGDVNYISKHNNNYTVIKDAIDALQLSLSGSQSAVTNFPSFAQAILGLVVGKLSETDCVASDAGSAILDITAGSIWVPSAGQVRTTAGASLDFTGQSTGTYYTHMDSVGTLSFDQTATNVIHTISFTAPSTFTTITESAVVVWGNAVFQAAKTNSALGGQVFEELDDLTEALGGATASLLAKTITASDVTLTDAEAMNYRAINLTGTLTGNRNLIVPDYENVYTVRNATSGAFDVTVKTSAQLGGEVVTQGSTAILVCDGTDVLSQIIEGIPAGSTEPFIVGAWKNGAPTASERVLGFVIPGGLTGLQIAAGATNSQAEAETSATAQTDFDLQKNGSSFGTIRWAAAGTVATFVSVSLTTFAAGDTIEIQAPGSPDATLANLYFTLFLTRDADFG